jgi:hypothetical protein
MNTTIRQAKMQTKREAEVKKATREAILTLYSLEMKGTGSATPEQLLKVAERFEMDVWQLECLYLDACDRRAEA